VLPLNCPMSIEYVCDGRTRTCHPIAITFGMYLVISRLRAGFILTPKGPFVPMGHKPVLGSDG
jgi:hypothetical protein